MLITLIALTACHVGSPPPAQTSGSPAYNPYNSTAVSIALTGINVLRAGEAEGDEPYILAYEYGVQIPVIKGVLQKPRPLPLRLVGKGSFDGIRSGYDWAKPNNLVQFRGYRTYFQRQKDAWVLFGLVAFVFDHDEYNETQLSELKRRATGRVRTALENTLRSDPKFLIDGSPGAGTMLINGFSTGDLKSITDMFKNKPDNIVGNVSVILLSKPIGIGRGVPEDLIRVGGGSQGIPANGNSAFSKDMKSSSSFGNEAVYRGEMRVTGLIIRHR